jgi:hypothetical protein
MLIRSASRAAGGIDDATANSRDIAPVCVNPRRSQSSSNAHLVVTSSGALANESSKLLVRGRP